MRQGFCTGKLWYHPWKKHFHLKWLLLNALKLKGAHVNECVFIHKVNFLLCILSFVSFFLEILNWNGKNCFLPYSHGVSKKKIILHYSHTWNVHPIIVDPRWKGTKIGEGSLVFFPDAFEFIEFSALEKFFILFSVVNQLNCHWNIFKRTN